MKLHFQANVNHAIHDFHRQLSKRCRRRACFDSAKTVVDSAVTGAFKCFIHSVPTYHTPQMGAYRGQGCQVVLFSDKKGFSFKLFSFTVIGKRNNLNAPLWPSLYFKYRKKPYRSLANCRGIKKYTCSCGS